MLQFLVFAILGIGMGTVTGLIPGLHVNNIVPLLVGLTATSSLSKYQAVSFIVGMMLTHTFLDFIPSTFLGVPEKDTALSVLPAHRLVQKGRGYEVIKLTGLGSLGALIFSAILIWPTTPLVKPFYQSIDSYMHIILLGIVIIMIYLENSWKSRIEATMVFLLSGILGLLVLNTNLSSGSGSFMPLLGGLFGMSVLIGSLNTENGIPPQTIGNKSVQIYENAKPILTGASAGFITGIIPGVGPAQGTFLTQTVTDGGGARKFLVGVSGVNTAKALLSFVALYAIGKPRSGAAVAVGEIMNIHSRELILLVGISLFAGGIATVLHLKIGKMIARRIEILPYRKMCVSVMTSIVVFSYYYAGPMGLLILFAATCLGLIPSLLGIKRTHCMGCLMVPVMLYFAGLDRTLLGIIGL